MPLVNGSAAKATVLYVSLCRGVIARTYEFPNNQDHGPYWNGQVLIHAESVRASDIILCLGKSTFIKSLTNDDEIFIGHTLKSQTTDLHISRYVHDGIEVTLVDTPGFDDSREGVTDTDILSRIAEFLQEEGGRKLNGLVYLHRISDPRMGGQVRMNTRMFEQLCGDKLFPYVRIVTTFWSRVGADVGPQREVELATDAFKPFIDGGAKLVRYDQGPESARSIMSEFIHNAPFRTKLQEELAAGKVLADTSAASVILEDMKDLRQKHDNEIAELKRELEEAAKSDDEELKAGLAEDLQKLEEALSRMEADQQKLQTFRPTANPNEPGAPPILSFWQAVRSWFLYHLRTCMSDELHRG